MWCVVCVVLWEEVVPDCGIHSMMIQVVSLDAGKPHEIHMPYSLVELPDKLEMACIARGTGIGRD